MSILGKQKLFADHYITLNNGTKAAILAGYSERTAGAAASRLLKDVNVLAYIKEQTATLAEKLNLTQEDVLKQYKRIAFFDARKVYKNDGSVKPVNEWDEDCAAAITGIEVDEIIIEGMVVGVTKKIKLGDKKSALDSVCKVLGHNAPDKKDIRHESKDEVRPMAKLPGGGTIQL